MESAETAAKAVQASLMDTLEKAAHAQNPPTDTGQKEPETQVEQEQKQEPEKKEAKPTSKKEDKSKEPKVEVEKEKEPVKSKKWWKTPEEKSGDKNTPAETVDWSAKYKELETQYSSLKAEREKMESAAEIKLAKKIAEHGGIDKLLGKLQVENPTNKSFDQLLRDRTIRSLKKLYGKDNITEDLIEDQLEKVKDKDVVTQEEMAEAELNYQLRAFNKQLDEFKPEQSAKAESFAKDLQDSHTSSLGKQILGLPITEDRHQQMEQLLREYSEGKQELTGSDLYEYLFFKANKDEIFEAVWKLDREEKLTKEISKLQGKDVRVGNTRMNDMGTVHSKEEESYNSLVDLVGMTGRAMTEKFAHK